MTTRRDFHTQLLSSIFAFGFNASRFRTFWEHAQTRANLPRVLSEKTLSAGQLFFASLIVAITIACGSTTPLPQLGPPPSTPGPVLTSSSEVVETCNEPGNILPSGDPTQPLDLQINGINCIVNGNGNAGGVSGSYVYRNVNIWNGGSLTFSDAQIDFHAHSILIEKNGTLQAGATSPMQHQLTIWLWGAANDSIPSITCLSDSKNQCGVSDADWNSNPNVSMKQMPTMPCTPASSDLNLPKKDCFYQYDVMESGDIPGAYFGKKVLAVSALGSLVLRGAKAIRTGPGPAPEPIEDKPADSSTSWARLTQTLKGGEPSFTIDRAVPTWSNGDHIVVTTTDYLPSHSEELVIKNVTNGENSATITIDPMAPTPLNKVQYAHYGKAYDYSAVVTEHPNTGPVADTNVKNLPAHNVETRAIVALLTRNIVVASEGATPTFSRTDDHFPVMVGSYYGGHTIVRQGFTQFAVQGVEFYQLGQGGNIGHYPVHFHMDRSVPQPNGNFLGTYVADSSIVDSMTRFITVHATQGVTLARNVGYKSIGHGFYLEDATEIGNRLYSNVGISVRGALADSTTNPRMVPGILDLPIDQLNALPKAGITPIGPPIPPAQVGAQIADIPPYSTDVTTPSVFWIMNTWNDFEYNAAVGAGACGACYWMVPGGFSFQGSELQNGVLVPAGPLQGGPSKYETWTDYAGMQKQDLTTSFLGGAPLMTFTGNSCTAAMNSISTVGQTSPCDGILFGDGSQQSTNKNLYSVPNPNSVTFDQYPAESGGQRAKTTLCDKDHPPRNPGAPDPCSTAPPCTGEAGQEGTCAATVFDHFTTSFNWPQTNFAAIWLRGWWYLLQNTAITDVQNGGLTFITGGGYTRSDAAQGFWSVLKNSIMVGNTQAIDQNTKVPDNAYASNAGPFNPSGLACAYNTSYCISVSDGISFQISNFGVNQRLFNIYDGPANQYNNIYSDVHVTHLGTLQDCRGAGGNAQPGGCSNQSWMNGFALGVTLSPPGNQLGNDCVLPNAAIAWKQPNGFYYPPAFNSDNLAFSDVDIRHFVIQPLADPDNPAGDNSAIQNTYCTWNPGMFATSFTDIDRQTELTDNDGSLTGLTSNYTKGVPPGGPTISVTKDPFFDAPLVTDQCASGQLSPSLPTSNGSGTASTSPYEYFTTAIVSQCAVTGSCGPISGGPASYWDTNCTTPACYGVPLYRQTLTTQELNDFNTKGTRPAIKMMGQASAQRSTLTLNHAQYYIDTTVPATGTDGQYHSGPPAYPVQFINAFQPNQIYSVFFLFAKNTAQQTYYIYVGPNQDIDVSQTVVPARMTIPDNTFKYVEVTGGSWIPNPTYDKTTGLLTVNIDLSQVSDLQPQKQSAFCQPASFCSWNTSTSTCGCAPNSVCTDDQVCSYATKDIDCPADGCYGFNLHMPSGFATARNGQPIAPRKPVAFPSNYFQDVSFVNANQGVAGTCYYQNAPTPQAKAQSRK